MAENTGQTVTKAPAGSGQLGTGQKRLGHRNRLGLIGRLDICFSHCAVSPPPTSACSALTWGGVAVCSGFGVAFMSSSREHELLSSYTMSKRGPTGHPVATPGRGTRGGACGRLLEPMVQVRARTDRSPSPGRDGVLFSFSPADPVRLSSQLSAAPAMSTPFAWPATAHHCGPGWLAAAGRWVGGAGGMTRPSDESGMVARQTTACISHWPSGSNN